jgi:CPA2 family monovalent cation:H+ antiporter-2
MALPLLFDIGIIIVFSAILAYMARFLRQPIIIAYVLAGLIVGPAGLGLITNTEEITLLSELGIIFLLFSVGLEIDFRRLSHVGFATLVGGTVQVMLTFFIGFFIGMLFGLAPALSVYIGLLLAFSSTMIVAKILADKNELSTLHGRIMLGILLLQDIIAVVALPLLGNMEAIVSLDFVLSILFRGLGLFVIAILLNKFFFPKILDYAAKKHEILFLTAVASCFFFIGASYFLGFSIAIGGFIAGISMANFPYNVEIEGEVHSLRDFFSILFFSSLGMQLNFWAISSYLPLFITLLLLLIVLKPVILTLTYLMLGYGGRTSGYVGLGMGQASEFMFIIAAEMLLLGSITREFYSLLLGLVVISIIITPYFMMTRKNFYHFFSRLKLPRRIVHSKSISELENPPEKALDNHIIIFGAHRMGEKVVKYLTESGEKLVVVERDPEIVKDLSRRGIFVRYGDAENEDMLQKIFINRAKLLILTIPSAELSSFVIARARKYNPKLRIFARAHSELDAERLYKAGADIVIMPEFVSSKELIKRVDHFLREKKI